MKWRSGFFRWVVLTGISIVSCAGFCIAKNNQTWVIGAGIGVHGFAQDDDLRRDSDKTNLLNQMFNADTNDEMSLSRSRGFFLEWYLFGNLGLGYRYFYQDMDSTTSDYNSYFPAEKYDFYRRFEIVHHIATIQFVPLGGTRYARMVLVMGAGPSTYKFEEDYQTKPANARDYDFEGETGGKVGLLGISVDWGGSGFGARAGAEYLATDFEEVTVTDSNGNDRTLELNGSGATAYLRLRWAF